MKTYSRHSVPRIPVPRIRPRRSGDFGSGASLPFSVPVTLHDKGNAPQAIEAPFVSAFQGQESDRVVILYQDYEESKAGLYVYDQNAWHFVVAFSFVTNFVVNGGNCHVYVDPISEQTPPTGSIIFNDGEPVAGNSIPAGAGWWAALEYNFVYQLRPATTATLGGVIVKEGLDVDGSGNLSTAIQKVAGVSPDTSHNVPLGVANITGAAPLASPVFTGEPQAPTQVATDDSSHIATTAFSQAMYGARIHQAGDRRWLHYDYTLTDAEVQCRILYWTAQDTGSPTVTFPVKTGRWLIINNSSRTFHCRTEVQASGSYLLVPAHSIVDVYAVDTTGNDEAQSMFEVPSSYRLPIASTTALGGIIVKDGLNVDGSGNLSAAIQQVAGVSPDATHNVPLSVGDITGAAPLASPSFTGEPQAPTQAATDNSTRIATTAFSQAMYGMRIHQAGDRSWMHYDWTLSDAEIQCRILYWTARDNGSPIAVFPVKTGRWLIINNSHLDIHCHTSIQTSGTYLLVPAYTVIDVYAVDTTGNDEAQSMFEVPSSYRLPIATTSQLGGVIVKEGLSVDGSGNLSTAIQKVAGVSPDGAHNVPLAVANITGAAPLDSPALMGLPTTPYPDLVFQQYKNNDQIASLRFVTDRQLSVASVDWTGIVSRDIAGDLLAHHVMHWTGTPNGGTAVGSFGTTWGRWLIVNDTNAQIAVKTSVQTGGNYLTLGPGTHDVYAVDTTGNPNAQSMFETASGYRLPTATTSTLGGVIVKAGLSVDGSGNLSTNIQRVAGVGPGSDNNVALKVDNIAGAAPLDSPSFIGNPKAPTADVTNNSTAIATTAWYSEIIQSAYVRNWTWYDWDMQGDELRRRVMYWTGSPGSKTVATFHATGGRWLLINESSGTIYVKTNKQTDGTYLAIPKGSVMDVYAIDTSDPSAQSMFVVPYTESIPYLSDTVEGYYEGYPNYYASYSIKKRNTKLQCTSFNEGWDTGYDFYQVDLSLDVNAFLDGANFRIVLAKYRQGIDLTVTFRSLTFNGKKFTVIDTDNCIFEGTYVDGLGWIGYPVYGLSVA